MTKMDLKTAGQLKAQLRLAKQQMEAKRRQNKQFAAQIKRLKKRFKKRTPSSKYVSASAVTPELESGKVIQALKQDGRLYSLLGTQGIRRVAATIRINHAIRKLRVDIEHLENAGLVLTDIGNEVQKLQNSNQPG